MSGRAGVVLRRRRATDVETVFGDIKSNWGFKRFTLRGLEKASLEWGLAALGHNMRKLHEAVSRGNAAKQAMARA
ncbi:transposase [Gordonibacter pamelaeae]|uniref:transposase n=1 Tax=Gordonibacter pamelaeae TaxID=471189 RepID=UPI002670619D|nr:transposase [Gordonibacter pamelaeae]